MSADHSRHQPKRPPYLLLTASAAMFLAMASPVLAHHPMGGATPATFMQGLLSGIGHPVIGADHLAFLIVATLLASGLSGIARFVVPVAFVCATIVGALMHVAAGEVPMVETLISLTVVIGGVLAVAGRVPGALFIAVVFAFSGILHGYAYGEAIVGAEPTPLLAYLVGFSAVQYGLIVVGVLGLERIATYSDRLKAMVTRVGGIGVSLVGSLFVVSSVT